MTSDPRRLVEDGASPALATLLRAAEGDRLDAPAVERVRVSVAGRVGLGDPGSSASAGARPLGLAGWGLRLGLPLAVVAGALVLLRPVHPSAVPLPSAIAPTPAVRVVPADSTPVASPALDTSHSAAEEPQLLPSMPSSVAVPTKARAISSSTAHPRTEASPASAPAPSPPTSGSPREGTLLLEARRALATDPGRALELVQEHTMEFPRSQLTPERDRIRAEAEKSMAR